MSKLAQAIAMAGKTTPRCIVARIIHNTTDDETRNALTAALTDRTTWPASTLARVLLTHGTDVSATSVKAHRTGICSCR